MIYGGAFDGRPYWEDNTKYPGQDYKYLFSVIWSGQVSWRMNRYLEDDENVTDIGNTSTTLVYPWFVSSWTSWGYDQLDSVQEGACS